MSKADFCSPVVNVTTITHEEWLRYRQSGIGGSDSSTIVGLNPYNSQYCLYLDKQGEIEAKADNEAMRQGRNFEQYVADRWMEATGKKCHKNNFMWRSKKWPHMLADIDREVNGENAGLECKTTSVYNKADLAGGEVPATYYVQCQHYMAVLGFDRMYLAVLVLNKGFYHFVIERDEAEIEALAKAEAEFWAKVQRRTPPEVDGSDATMDALREKYPNGREDLPVMELPKSCSDDLEALVGIQADLKIMKESETAVKARIMEKMGEHPLAIAGNFVVSWKNQSAKRVDTAKLKKLHPDVYAECLNETTSRAFRFKQKKA